MNREINLIFPRLQTTLYGGAMMILALLAAVPLQAADARKTTQPEAAAAPAPPVNSESGPDQEIGSIEAGIKANPDDATLHVRLGHLLLKKGNLDEAKRSFDEALKLNPRSHAAMTGEGIVLARQGKLREAEKVLKEALIQNPDPVRTHYELGLVYEKLGEFDKAIAEYKAALSKYQQGRK